MKKQLFFCFLLIGFLFVISCKKENPTNTEPINKPVTTTDLSGFGDRSGAPSGIPFQLPHKVEVITPMVRWSIADSDYIWYGMGTLATCFTIANYNMKPETVIFPAGLIFTADNDSSQNTLIAHDVTITLPANSTKKIMLNFFCINHKKPASNTNFYTMSVVSDNDQVATMTNALNIKNDSIVRIHRYDLQKIIWHISDSTGITQADLDKINSW